MNHQLKVRMFLLLCPLKPELPQGPVHHPLVRANAEMLLAISGFNIGVGQYEGMVKCLTETE